MLKMQVVCVNAQMGILNLLLQIPAVNAMDPAQSAVDPLLMNALSANLETY